jgi:3-oxoacyl-[acyl-carrier protein] reductase
MRLAGKVAIVTGGGSGFGEGIVRKFVAEGASVVLMDRDEAAAARVAREAGDNVRPITGDVSTLESFEAAADLARSAFGGLHILVNNAGTTKHVPHHDLDGLTSEDFQRIYAVNTIGPFQMIRAARAQLEAGAKAFGKPSAVVNVSSVAGISGGGSSVAYAASKGALNTMTQSLGRALAPLIRVNTVCPGYIDTPWFTKGRGEAGAKAVRDAVVAKVPLKIASSAEDIAQLVCFLASPASSNMTGEFVRMDAGMHLVL